MVSMSAPFLLVGNRLSLDFINTEVISEGERRDMIQSSGDLARWALEAGACESTEKFRSGTKDQLAKVRALRGALRQIFEAWTEGSAPRRSALRILNEQLKKPVEGLGLRIENGVFAREGVKLVDIDHVLRRVAEDAAQLITSEERERIRCCAHQGCILMFVDRSRRGARRWCSMSLCGNRAKVAAHLRRSRPEKFNQGGVAGSARRI